MLQSLVLVAALRDLVIYIPILVIIAVLYSFGLRIRFPGTRNPIYEDDAKE